MFRRLRERRECRRLLGELQKVQDDFRRRIEESRSIHVKVDRLTSELAGLRNDEPSARQLVAQIDEALLRQLEIGKELNDFQQKLNELELQAGRSESGEK